MDILLSCNLYGHFLALFTLSFVIQAEATDHLWVHKTDLDNMTATSGHKLYTRTFIECGRSCSLNHTCVSFFIMPDQQLNCQLHDSVLGVLDGITTGHSSYYYVLDEAELTTTTTMVTTTTSVPPPEFTCPPDDTIFRTVHLSDGEQFSYKVVKTGVTQPGAIAGCASQGGFLSRVKTVAKMNMLLNLVRNCPGYSGDEYYVDGSNANAADYNAPGAWTFIDGDPVPMSNDFWGESYPNYPNIQHCLRMQKSAANYKFDDCSCNLQCYYICEK